MSVDRNIVRAWMKARIAPVLIIAAATIAAVASYPVLAATPDQDFAARCAASGVVLCKGLDTASDIAANIQPAGDGKIEGSLDTSNKTSGAGSLRFTLRAGVNDTNIGGAYSTSMGHTFGVGDTIYVQWRQMVTPEFLSNNNNYWQSSVKQINIHGSSSTCQGAEYTTAFYGDGNKPEMYTNCGDGFDTNASTNALCNGSCTGDILLQQGSNLTPSPNGDGYNCHYNNQVAGKGDGSGCFFMPANTWVTFYEKIKIGAFGGSTSAVDAWVSVNGGPYKQFQRAAGITFNKNGDNNFQMIRLETYMTELKKAAPVTTYIWYDELIVSTQPIALPGNNGVVAMPAPTNLRVIQ